jgi:ABC-type sulfate transport system substrate-binding protein
MTARRHFMNVSDHLVLVVALAGSAMAALAKKSPVTLLNLTYDLTRELYRYAREFAPLTLFGIDEVFVGWIRVAGVNFSDGAIFDQINLKK